MSSATAAPPRARTTSRAASTQDEPGRVGGWLQRLDSPVTSYYVLLSVTVVLVVIGLIMVLSASSVKSLVQTDNATPYVFFRKQLQFAAMGADRHDRRGAGARCAPWKALSVPDPRRARSSSSSSSSPRSGCRVNGNRNWLAARPDRPSSRPSSPRSASSSSAPRSWPPSASCSAGCGTSSCPFLFPVAAVTIGLVLLGHDLGTVMVMGGIVAGLLFAAGVPAPDVRLRRRALRGPRRDHGRHQPQPAPAVRRLARQGHQPLRRLPPDRCTAATPSPTAAGGASGSAPAARSGSGCPRPTTTSSSRSSARSSACRARSSCSALFCALALVCYRIVLRTNDTFVRIATAGVMAWIVCQAIINIGAVIGLLPVIGVPLPLVSYGGSSLMTTMFALGMLLSFARQEPGCREALSAKPSVVRRSLAVLPGRRGRR